MKNTKELREFLVGQMERVANGEVELDKAKGVSNLAQQIYNTMNIEIKFASAKSKLGDEKIESVEFDV